MKTLPNLLVVLGVCLGALGAAGFHTPRSTVPGAVAEREPYSLLLLVAGTLCLAVGGGLGKKARRTVTAGEADGQDGKQTFAGEIAAIRDIVVELDAQRDALAAAEIKERIERLMAEQYFDLTSRHEELARLVGFGAYARVWEGVATGERLLNRAWTMITDGHDDEGRAELPLARASLEQAARAMDGS